MLTQAPKPEDVATEPPSPGQRIYVPLSATDLEAGRKITAGDVANRSFTPDAYAKSKYSTTLHISQSSQIIGRVLEQPLKAGSVFVPDSFFPEGTGPTVANAVPYGKRAVTVEITGSGFVDGFATPGTLVDVLFRSSKSELEEIPETTVTILHAIEVLAVNSNSYPNTRPVDEASEEVPESVKVTLAVFPGEVNKLKALEGRGELSLALRSEEELGPDQLQAQLEEANRALANVAMEQQALQNLKELAERGEVAPFSQGDRLVELAELVPAAEFRVGALQRTISAQNAAREPNRQTLADVLDVNSQQVTVALAASDLRPDRLVRPGDLQMLEMTPSEARKQGYAVVLDEEPSQLVGRTLRVALKKGAVVTSDLFYPEGVRPGVAERLPPGFRAVTVTLNRESFADGYAAPETDVDVFFRAEGLQDVPETTLMVLEGLTVLAVDGSVYPFPGAAGDDSKEDNAVKVTLAVPVHSVGRVKALEGRGEITLALRSSKERSPLTIARELADATTELEKARLEADALSRLREIAGSRGLEQSQNNRLRALKNAVPDLEDKVALLEIEQANAKKTVPDITLADILGLQPPAQPIPPASIEVYMGGQHKTTVLPEQPVSINTASRTTRPAVTSARPEVPIRPDTQRYRATTRRSAVELPGSAGPAIGPVSNPAVKPDGQPSASTTDTAPADETSASLAAPETRQHFEEGPAAIAPNVDKERRGNATANDRIAHQRLKAILPPAPVPPVAAVTPGASRPTGTMSLELAKSVLKTNRELARMVAVLESRLREESTRGGKVEPTENQRVLEMRTAANNKEQPTVPEPLRTMPRLPYVIYAGGKETSIPDDGKQDNAPTETVTIASRSRVVTRTKGNEDEGTIQLFLGGVRN